MEINETVLQSVSADELAGDVNHAETCPFCQSDTDPNMLRENVFEEEGDLTNSAGKLGRAMAWPDYADNRREQRDARPQVEIAIPIIAPEGVLGPQESKEVVLIAPHHLIPGNASLLKSSLYKEGCLGNIGTAHENAGYNVNCAENGVWVPTSYGHRGVWKDLNARFAVSHGTYQESLATLSMQHVGTQFHDSHEKYSKLVKTGLNRIYDKLVVRVHLVRMECPQIEKQIDGATQRQPLTALVHRLHEMSRRLTGFVSTSTLWRQNVFLSRFARQLINKAVKKRGVVS